MIRHLYLAVSLALAATAAFAQPYPHRGYPNPGAGVVERALGDLDRAQSARFMDHHERKHLEQARKDLIRFHSHWREGRFDRDRLDGAIEHIQRLVDSRRLHPRDRQILAGDLHALRDFRARGGYAGGPYYRH